MKEQISSQAGALVDTLIERGMRVTTAESCTGGLVSAAITEVRGSSAAFEGGAVCYANEVKSFILGVNEEIFATKGAVSAECAVEMAVGAATLFSADLAIALTGIAGPDGGTPQKPVGTVFICVATKRGQAESNCGILPENAVDDHKKEENSADFPPDLAHFSTMVVENHFSGNREEIRKQSVLKALRLANAALSGEIYDDLALPLCICSDGAGEDLREDLPFEELLPNGLPLGGMPCFGEELSPFEGALLEEL